MRIICNKLLLTFVVNRPVKTGLLLSDISDILYPAFFGREASILHRFLHDYSLQ